MKYFKFTQVYSETQQSVLLSSDAETYDNRVFPSCIDNLNLLWNANPYYFGTGDDSSTADPSNLVDELTLSDFISELTTTIGNYKDTQRNVNLSSYNIRHDQLLTQFEYSNPAGVVYKYNEANAFLNDGTLSGWLQAESEVAGITTASLAQDYVDDYDDFRVQEAKLAGLKTKCNNRIELMVVESDGSNLSGIATYQSATEELGLFDFGSEITEEVRASFPEFVNKENDQIFDNYFSPDLGLRWDYRAMITL
jgi:hypothetical protein|tara:strand:+ start:601 stop:1356 length:756 start_codon:yes stop_codon:yes gene_type:complete